MLTYLCCLNMFIHSCTVNFFKLWLSIVSFLSLYMKTKSKMETRFVDLMILMILVPVSLSLLQSLKRSTFPFLRSFTVRSPSVHRAFSVRSSCAHRAFIVHSFAFTVHKAFSVRSPFIHLSFTKRSSFIQRSVFIVIRNSEVERSISRSWNEMMIKS